MGPDRTVRRQEARVVSDKTVIEPFAEIKQVKAVLDALQTGDEAKVSAALVDLGQELAITRAALRATLRAAGFTSTTRRAS